jgi:hypothetical protein
MYDEDTPSHICKILLTKHVKNTHHQQNINGQVVNSRASCDRRINGVFGLRNEVVNHILTPQIFVWFVEWSELIHHHLIPQS